MDDFISMRKLKHDLVDIQTSIDITIMTLHGILLALAVLLVSMVMSNDLTTLATRCVFIIIFIVLYFVTLKRLSFLFRTELLVKAQIEETKKERE